jgi:hypothetical protein
MRRPAMTATERTDLFVLVLDRLRHAVQYAEAARVTAEEAIAYIEKAQREEAEVE